MVSHPHPLSILPICSHYPSVSTLCCHNPSGLPSFIHQPRLIFFIFSLDLPTPLQSVRGVPCEHWREDHGDESVELYVSLVTRAPVRLMTLAHGDDAHAARVGGGDAIEPLMTYDFFDFVEGPPPEEAFRQVSLDSPCYPPPDLTTITYPKFRACQSPCELLLFYHTRAKKKGISRLVFSGWRLLRRRPFLGKEESWRWRSARGSCRIWAFRSYTSCTRTIMPREGESAQLRRSTPETTCIMAIVAYHELFM